MTTTPNRTSFEVELREEDGREPSLRGVMLTEGRAASGGRREVFALGSVRWPSDGVGISVGHDGGTETRAHPVRDRSSGELRITARATRAIREAVEAGARWMSVEFVALEERETRGGVREVLSALVNRAALTASPEFDTTAAEVRTRRRRLWL